MLLRVSKSPLLCAAIVVLGCLLVSLPLEPLNSAHALRVVFKTRVQPDQDQQTIDSADTSSLPEEIPLPPSATTTVDEGDNPHAEENVDEQSQENVEEQSQENGEEERNQDDATNTPNEIPVDESSHEPVADHVDAALEPIPDLDKLIPLPDFPKFRQTTGDQPIDIVITNNPIVPDQTSLAKLGPRISAKVDYGGQIGLPHSSQPPPKGNANYGGPVPIVQKPTPPVPKPEYGAPTNTPVYGGHVSEIREIKHLEEQHKELASRVTELEHESFPEWALRESACPDKWKNLGFIVDEQRVQCQPPEDGDTPGNARCKDVAKFSKVYDRCGWSRHCKAPWSKYNCYPENAAADVSKLNPVVPSGLSGDQMKEAEDLRQKILKEEKDNPLEKLTGVPNPPPLNLPSVPSPPPPPAELNKKSWF